ncbi:Fumonisin cluster-specific transcription factor FUM21 [Colletotrichum fructicola Nara gc5]|uniref:Fumonisin cluster-specific transcription factor FUM21 n=1 Tax=Colletotrichum fructicola (strain Nara gc5) TaxID=1213859 RepID=A0A7J6IMM7_COLFN|nr:Fumonisin cluster-specific transcription factor FUM21 [Colletotrichum fructicola Nara gc5]
MPSESRGQAAGAIYTRLNKSCDQCRNRKVRCIVQSPPIGGPVLCNNCIPETKRNMPLQHITKKAAFKDSAFDSKHDEFSVLKMQDRRAPSSGLAYFSDQKVDQLVQRIGDSRIRDLVNGIDAALQSSILTRTDEVLSRLGSERRCPPVRIPADESRLYICQYFDTLHPVYPFLNRDDFEEKAFSPELEKVLEDDLQYSSLYHAVLALGCQHFGQGSFDPGKGRAWELFRICLSHTADILNFGDSLLGLQALTAMSVFSMSACYLQAEHSILAEATRMALALRYHKSALEGGQAVCRRTFWVLYHLEKQYSFQARRSSGIADYDVGCPVPNVPESTFGEYNWFLSSIRFGRVLSVAYEQLFSVTASTRDTQILLSAISRVRGMLEDWRQSVPVDFRPKEQLNKQCLTDPRTRQIALSTQLYYFHLVIALERMSLQLDEDGGQRQQESRKDLLQAARTIIELTRYIDVEPYTPVFTLAIMPLSALFILFDFIIYNPLHPDVRSNLTLLDIAVGHFSLLDHASGGSLPGSHLSEFSHIARRYVHELPDRTVDGIHEPGSSSGGRQDSSNETPDTTEQGTTETARYLEPGSFNEAIDERSGLQVTLCHAAIKP